MLNIHENTIRRKNDEGIKKPCRINTRGEQQFRKAEFAALLSMLKEYNYYKRILV
jgi:hypothetical protein